MIAKMGVGAEIFPLEVPTLLIGIGVFLNISLNLESRLQIAHGWRLCRFVQGAPKKVTP